MTLETLPPVNAIDFRFPSPENCSRSNNLSWGTHAVVHDIISSPRSNNESHVIGEAIYPSLPPLLNGHPEVHMRNGVMNSARLSLANKPDAEKAFFVADLGQVYRQHQRWKSCLPEIQPFYGPSFFSLLLILSIQNIYLIHSRQM